MSLKTIIEGFQKELEEKIKAHENAISASRKIIVLSKQSITAVHREEIDLAKEKIAEARKLLREMENILSSNQDLASGIVRTAYQEYAEAGILLMIVERNKFPNPDELGIPTLSYILGIADAIGEFRRRALESLRRRKLKKAEKSLKFMDEIYSELVVLENVYSLAPELRHKVDTARHLIELTIGDVATETGRSLLEKSIRQLEKKIKLAK